MNFFGSTHTGGSWPDCKGIMSGGCKDTMTTSGDGKGIITTGGD